MEGDIIVYDENVPVDDDYLDDAMSNTDAKWDLDPETGTVPIPYKIDNDIGSKTREYIDQAINEFHRKTCIR